MVLTVKAERDVRPQLSEPQRLRSLIAFRSCRRNRRQYRGETIRHGEDLNWTVIFGLLGGLDW